MRNLMAATTLALTTLLASCHGHDEECGEHSHDSVCTTCSGDEDPAVPGTKVTGDNGVFSIELVTASPQITPGANSIVIEIRDAAGELVDGITFDRIEVRGNGHGSPLVPETVPAKGAGWYQVNMLAYLEPVPSTVTFTISKGDATDVVVFTFCVEAAPAQ